MRIWNTIAVLFLVAAIAHVATSRNHPVLVHLAVNVIPEFINAYVSVLGVKIGCTSQHLDGGSHPTTHHHFVISVEFRYGLLQNW